MIYIIKLTWTDSFLVAFVGIVKHSQGLRWVLRIALNDYDLFTGDKRFAPRWALLGSETGWPIFGRITTLLGISLRLLIVDEH